MKARILPTAVGVALFVGLVGLFGHSLAVEANQAATQPSQTSQTSAWVNEKEALQKAHSRDITKFTVSLDAANQQVTTLRETNATITAQKAAACARLQKASLTIPECR